MQKFLLAAAAVVALGVSQARASTTFDFTQTTATPAGAFTFSGDVTVSDSAALNGFNFIAHVGYVPSSLDGLLGLNLAISGAYAPLSPSLVLPRFTLANFLDPRDGTPGSGRDFIIGLYGSAERGIFGELKANDSVSDIILDLSGFSATGHTETDAGGACGETGTCRFTAAVTEQVPEPSSIALLGAGLLAFVRVRRRKGKSSRDRG